MGKGQRMNKGTYKGYRRISIYIILVILLTTALPGRRVDAIDMQTPIPSIVPEPSRTPEEASVTPEPSKTPGLANETPEPSKMPGEVNTTPESSKMPEDPSITPEVTSIPEKPGLTPEPTGMPEDPGVTPEPTGISEEPSVMPEPTTVITPSPAPTATPYSSKTLELMSSYDYVGKSVTGLTRKKVKVSTLKKQVASYGTLYGTGMPYNEYKEAMSYMWEDATEYNKKPVKITVDINKTMNYDTYVDILKKLSRYEGVYLYKIGKSTEGRDLYAIEIDIASKHDKNIFMLTGQVHAREFAGGTYIVKQFVDLVQKAQTDKKTMELLKKNKYVAVPIINVDGREAIITSASKWTTKAGELWKAYTDGTDGNRNFPGLQWGQVAKGNRLKKIIEKAPGYANYPGSYAGSNCETKAMMKWLYHYIVVEQADYYLDLHQQGSVIYAGKSWQTKAQEQRCKNLRTDVLSLINSGKTKRKYCRIYEESTYGLAGEGSSLTDYAVGLAIGAKFSPAYGFHVFTDGKEEYALLQVKDLDKKPLKVKEANKSFAAITIEIGYGKKYLGNSSSTRSLLASEYTNYNYHKLLEALPTMLN